MNIPILVNLVTQQAMPRVRKEAFLFLHRCSDRPNSTGFDFSVESVVDGRRRRTARSSAQVVGIKEDAISWSLTRVELFCEEDCSAPCRSIRFLHELPNEVIEVRAESYHEKLTNNGEVREHGRVSDV